MTRFLFAAAVGAIFALPAAADDPAPVTTAPAPTPVVTGPTYPAYPTTGVITNSSTTSTRRVGLLGRLRGRTTSGTVMSAPVGYGTGTVITTPGTIAPSIAPGTVVPNPMPRAGGTSMVVPAITGVPIVMAGGSVINGTVVSAGGRMTSSGVVIPAGGIVTTDGTVIPAGSMMPGTVMTSNGTMMTTNTVTTQRMGLIARLRMRR